MHTVEWSREEMQLLIDLRRERNNDYWGRFDRSKVSFWNEIVMQIEKELGMAFTGMQVRNKFTRMVKDCKVSKIQVKEIYIVFTKKFIYILIILIS